MAPALKKVRFGYDLAPLVADFDCRESRDRPPHPWEAEVNDWIKADPSTREGAQYRMTKQGGKCKVWLYVVERNDGRSDIVGYGSLTRSKWPDPQKPLRDPGVPAVPVSLIPSVGIQTPFQGGPPDAAPGERYSTQIINHLIYEARETLRERQPFLCLYVHPDNTKAIRFYRRVGFSDFAQTWTHPVTGTVYQGMILSVVGILAHVDP